MDNTATLIVRGLLAWLFLSAGFGSLLHLDDAASYLVMAHLPPLLLPLGIALELAGGALLLFGWRTRWTALALAEYSLFSAFVYNADMGWLLAVGLSLLAWRGGGRYSLDHRRERAVKAHTEATPTATSGGAGCGC